MARIVGIHGIGQQTKGPHTLAAAWLPAMQDGLVRAGGPAIGADDLRCAFYGDLFRPAGKAVGDPPYSARDVADPLERGLLRAWWQEAAVTDPQVPSLDARTKLRTPDAVQRALNALSHSRFFAGLAERALVGTLKQVHRYFTELDLRAQIRDRAAAQLGPDTRLIVGHSLGSVVAYEVLCAHPDSPVRALITFGSPLAIQHLVFDRLQPQPAAGLAAWPDSVRAWTNIADRGDVVALVKALRPRFGPGVEDVLVHNGATAHDVNPYLTTKEAGRAIAAALLR